MLEKTKLLFLLILVCIACSLWLLISPVLILLDWMRHKVKGLLYEVQGRR